MSQQEQASSSKGKKIELVIQQLNSLPTLPAVAARLLQITVRTDTQADEVVRLIESDPSLASKIITLSTRASMGVSKKTASLSKAVVLLGFDAVRNAVLSIKVFETLNRAKGADDTFDRVGFWKHSLAVACASKLLIEHIDPKADSEEAFVCGLLHDIGKLALDTALPRSFSRVIQLTESAMANIADVERKILGLDHTVVGRRLAAKWNLPESIAETLWLHHHWVKGLPDAVKNRSIVQTVNLADVLSRQLRLGYSGNHHLPQTASELAEEIGCNPDIIEKVARKLPEEISDRASILGLDDIEPGQLYHEALGEANSELGKLNSRLNTQNQRLMLRSRYFDLLVKLDEGLKIGQSPTEVCSLINELWYDYTGSHCCAVYSMPDDSHVIEGTIKVDSLLDPTVFMVDRSDDPDEANYIQENNSIFSTFAVQPVGQTHSWLFEQVAPMFEIKSTIMMPLRAGDSVIGAVLWQSSNNAEHYKQQIKEMQAFASSAAMAIQQAQRQEKQSMLCEQLALSNSLVHKAQQEITTKKSMAAVGEMACGAAHEINNPLAVIVGRSQLLASSEENSERKDILENIAKQGKEISNIIKELLDFAQPATPKPIACRAEDVIGKLIESTSSIAKERGITFETSISNNLPEMYVDQNQVVQALAELIYNAAESYNDGGGAITLSVRYNDLDDQVVIEVADQGCGMDEQTLRKAKDPFFSAKQAGRKRGLGLSRSVRCIESNGGKLHIESQEKKGTLVRIMLPVSGSGETAM